MKINPRKKILFVVNVDWFFISHRLILAKAAIKEGYGVFVACSDSGRKHEIESVGAIFIDLSFERSGTNPFKELITLRKFYKLYKEIKPSIVQHITLKPVTYGSLIALILKIPVVNSISGLGFNFTENKKGFSTYLMTILMRLGFNNKNLTCIFQNNDDRKVIESRDILKRNNEIAMIKGSGVDLKEFEFSTPIQKKRIEIILPARLLWDKGIEEFYKASLLLKKKYEGKILFKLIGIADKGNKAGITEDQLKNWCIKNYFVWIPYQKNMVPIYKQSDVVVLPSYREGMPKTLIEACAIGRPIVTTNAIGCRECVDEGRNGFKVPVKSVKELAFAIEKLILDENLRISMGIASREKAVKEFDQKDVVSKHLKIYKKMLYVN